jgi:predicted enzyme related to lactoylglutathione lyase
MATSTKKKSKRAQARPVPASLVWFEIPADDVERARAFYGKLFGWKIIWEVDRKAK